MVNSHSKPIDVTKPSNLRSPRIANLRRLEFPEYKYIKLNYPARRGGGQHTQDQDLCKGEQVSELALEVELLELRHKLPRVLLRPAPGSVHPPLPGKGKHARKESGTRALHIKFKLVKP